MAPASILLLVLGQVSGYSAGPGLDSSALHQTDGGVEEALADGGTTVVAARRESPAFTQDREFVTTRMWVLDPGRVTVEQWWNGFWGSSRAAPSSHPDDQLLQSEVEFGIAPHCQVDIYANLELNVDDSGAPQVAKGGHTGVAAELRVALGNYWGQIPLNPTLYFELTSQYYNSPRAEFRLLLGDTLFTPKLLFAMNLAFERNIFRDASSGIDYEIKADVGINYEVVPAIFRVGVEGVIGLDSHGTIDQHGRSLLHPVGLVGPGVVLTSPGKRIKMLAALLHGLADWDQPWQSTVIISSSFGM
jgi:hypothetical protein